MATNTSNKPHQLINNLIQSLQTKKSLRNIKSEIISIVSQLGFDGERQLVKGLVESIDFRDTKVQTGNKDQLKVNLLSQFVACSVANAAFMDYFAKIVEQASEKSGIQQFMVDFYKTLRITLPIQVLLAVSLVLSNNAESSKVGIQILRAKIREIAEKGKQLPFTESGYNTLMHIMNTYDDLEDVAEEIRIIGEQNLVQKVPTLKALQLNQIIDDIEGLEPDFLISPPIPQSPLASMITELGPTVTQSPQSLNQVFANYNNIDETAILQVFLAAANYQGKDSANWNFDNLVKVLIDKSPNVRLHEIIKRLDQPDLKFSSPQSLSTLFQIFHKLERYPSFKFPASILFERWKNQRSQAIFMLNYFEAGSPDQHFFQECKQRIVSLEGAPSVKITALNPQVLNYYTCLDFLEILIEISETDQFEYIVKLFDLPMQRCPDLLILGLVQIRPKMGYPLLDLLLGQLLPLYLSNHASSMEILEAIWKFNYKVMIQAFSELYRKDNSSLNLSRALDICQELKNSLLTVVNCKDYSFSVALGILAAKRDFLHLDHWISKKIKAAGAPFAEKLMEYLETSVFEPLRQRIETPDVILEKSQLTQESILIIFKTFLGSNFFDGKLPQRIVKMVNEKYQQFINYFPTAASTASWTDIEKEANSLYEQLLNGQMHIQQFMDRLIHFKNSKSEKEKTVYMCVMNNLLDEARYLYSYKYQPLMLMAELYGHCLNNDLLEGQGRDVAFKVVVENLKRRDHPRLYDFAYRSLEIMKGRLHEWPTKAVQLYTIDNLKERNLEMLEDIRTGIENKGIQIDIPREYYDYVQMRRQRGTQNHSYSSGNNQQGNMGNANSSTGIGGSLQQQQQQQHQFQKTNSLASMSAQGLSQNSGGGQGLQQPSLGGNNNNTLRVPTVNSQSSLNTGQPLYPNLSVSPGPGVSAQDQANFNAGGSNAQTSGVSQSLINQFNNNNSGGSFGGGSQQQGFGGGNTAGNQGFGGIGSGMGNSASNANNSGGGFASQLSQQFNNMSSSPQPQSQNDLGNPQTNSAPTEGPAPQREKPESVSLETLFKTFEQEDTDLNSDIKTKIMFLLNNTSNSNIEQKCHEFKATLNTPALCSWFAKFISLKRAPVENNLHTMYIGLAEKINKPEIFKIMTSIAFKVLNKILEADKLPLLDKTYGIEYNKQQVKNMGTWLGLLTLARNKPIIIRELDLKTFIIKCFFNQKVDIVIPVVCKILAAGAHQHSVFKPRNGYMRALLYILAEISDVNEIKIAVRCEIEVLFKQFEANKADFAKNRILQQIAIQKRQQQQQQNDGIQQQREQQQQHLQGFGNPMDHQQQQQYQMQQQREQQQQYNNNNMNQMQQQQQQFNNNGIQQQSNGNQMMGQNQFGNQFQQDNRFGQQQQQQYNQQQQYQEQQQQQQQQQNYSNDGSLAINELPQYITINAKYGRLSNDMGLKNMVAQALDKAIKDILPPVISRSVTIALITTKELVTMDFALEPDENKYLKGSILMIQNLAGNLALVTSREPLKVSFEQVMKSFFDQLNMDPNMKQDMMQTVTADNLDLGCALIKKAVVEKAVEEVRQDQTIMEGYEKRRMLRERGHAYFDENVLRYCQALPEPLRPIPGGLTKDQLRIYDDFGRSTRAPATKESRRLSLQERADRQLDPDSIALIQKFGQYVTQLDKELELFSQNQSQEKLREVQILHKNMMEQIADHGNQDDIIFECAVKIFEPFIEDKIQYNQINFFLAVLQELRKLDEHIPHTVLEWILQPPYSEKRLQKTDLIVKLIKENFISVSEIDVRFAESLEKSLNSPNTLFGIMKLVKTLVIDERLLETNFFKKTVEVFAKNQKAYSDQYPQIAKVFEEFRYMLTGQAPLNNQAQFRPPQDVIYDTNLQKAISLFNPKQTDQYENAQQKLEEWMVIGSEQDMHNFIKMLDTTIFQDDDQVLIKFFAYMTQICVDHALTSVESQEPYGKLAHNPAMDFSYIDAYTKLITVLLKSAININKNELLEKILTSIVQILTKNHTLHKKKFNQRPFFRIFYNLICDIKRKEYSFSNREISSFLLRFINVLDRLQPLKYPGFAFAWLEIISNRNFMPLVLTQESQGNQKNDHMKQFCILLVDLFKFFKETMIPEFYKTEFYKKFYKGSLRTLVVILRDFPDILIESSFLLVENIPPKFNQFRNMILSAFPKTMQPPDPFKAAEMKVESKEEFKVIPGNLFNFEQRLYDIKLNDEIYQYLTQKGDMNKIYFRNICSKFLIKDERDEIHINYPVLNSFVLFVPWMIYKREQDPQKQNELRQDSYELFWKLLISSNHTMKEALLTAIMNQIRYPNLITFYFTNFIFQSFSERKDESIQEEIFKHFIERLTVDRPHPWGVMYAFIELIKDQSLIKKKLFKNSDFEEIIRYVLRTMGKADSSRDPQAKN